MRSRATALILLFILIASSGCIGGWRVVSAPSAANSSTSAPAPPAGAEGTFAGSITQTETGNGQHPGTAGQVSAGESVAMPELERLTVGTGSLPAYGNESAPVAWIEFSDYQCPYCAKLFSQADSSVRENYVSTGKVRMYFRDYPLGFHEKSQDAALAARCAGSQGRFWDMHDRIFSAQDSWSGLSADGAVEEFKSYAGSLGLDTAKFSSCLSGPSTVSQVAIDQQEGGDYGVTGTPAVFLVLPADRTDYGALADAAGSTGGGVTIYDGGSDYVVLVGGAYPYSTFSSILDSVSYD